MAIKIGAFITITRPEQRGDTFEECLLAAEAMFDTVTVIDGEETWPQEFSWPLIGKHFQKGFEVCGADWVCHLDTDFFFHEKDYWKLREAIADLPGAPALSCHKWQFILPDRYNLKSRLVLLVNKRDYGHRIRFNGGRDLCQPTLDGKTIELEDIPQSRVEFYNYEKLIKTKEQIQEDVERMDRAYYRHFGRWLYSTGGERAYEGWYKMVKGRFSKPSAKIPLSSHPEVIQDTIKNLTPEMFGYNGFGLVEGKVYA